MKKALKSSIYIAIGAAMLSLTACSNVETPENNIDTVNVGNSNGLNAQNRGVDTPSAIMNDYNQLPEIMKAVARDDDASVDYFLATQKNDNSMAERVRNAWLKRLGLRGDWDLFQAQYRKLQASGIDQENRCYAELIKMSNATSHNALANEMINTKAALNPGCNALIAKAASNQQFSEHDVWARIRLLLSKNQVTEARKLANAIGQPLPNNLSITSGNTPAEREAVLYNVTNPGKRANIIGSLNARSGSLSPEQIGFAYGLAGLVQAKNQNASTALNYFAQADASQLDTEQWEWYARSALRNQNFAQVKNIILAMPKSLQDNETWQYWLARAYQNEGHSEQAKKHFKNAEKSGRNFYALLATESLGKKVNTTSNVGIASKGDVQAVAKDGAIVRAITLFSQAQNAGDRKIRQEAQAQWRYAVRDYNEPTLLASSQWANQNGFNEMTIYSADRTNKAINYPLRYLSPYRNTTEQYAAQYNTDPAWIYGLIRQESRFMLSASSHVGASGLMQIMPATAREIAQKLNMNGYSLTNIDNNIQMGTWYLGDIRNRLGSEVLATAGYNAGASRAKRWQAGVPLEGAIYAETIPFNETRDYVKKVMANTTYYASLFNEPQQSLTQRIGVIPAK